MQAATTQNGPLRFVLGGAQFCKEAKSNYKVTFATTDLHGNIMVLEQGV